MKRLSIISSVLLSVLLILVSVGLIKYFQTTQQSNPPANSLLTVATITPLPTATLTATLLPTFTATANPITKSTPTIMFSVGHTKPITLPTPTLIPSATPTPTFEPLHGQAIGGYVFSTARPVPNVPSGYYDLIEWLPDDPNKLLVLDNYRSVEVIDINTGEMKIYSDGTTVVKEPVWLPARQSVAYLTIDKVDRLKDYVWIVETNADLATLTPAFITSWGPPLVSSPNGSGIIVFDADWQLTQILTDDSSSIKLPSNTKLYKPPGQKHGEVYKVAQSPDKAKAFYYNDENLLLVDLMSGSLTEIDIENLKGDNMPPLKPIKDAVWSPDGTKIALHSIVSRYSLYWVILDLQTNHLTYLGDNISTNSNLTWGPDSKYILAYTSFDTHVSGYGLATLFLFDIESQQRYVVSALPEVAVINSSAPILWSPNGKHIAVVFGDEPENPDLYVIDVTYP